ncbi:hypothetical protein [Streptomyces sp. MNU76]|uniref:hypothetical protein n=1 Tax=Streptomyces sp. MNU76 TaxID=2560026 RepID=UPI002280B8F6|nr:hypothetical protein [Streptomyces sp. MNU76]
MWEEEGQFRVGGAVGGERGCPQGVAVDGGLGGADPKEVPVLRCGVLVLSRRGAVPGVPVPLAVDRLARALAHRLLGTAGGGHPAPVDEEQELGAVLVGPVGGGEPVVAVHADGLAGQREPGGLGDVDEPRREAQRLGTGVQFGPVGERLQGLPVPDHDLLGPAGGEQRRQKRQRHQNPRGTEHGHAHHPAAQMFHR